MIRILVVDDEIGICRSLEMLFKKEGYDVAAAHTASVAIPMITERDFEIIFTDLKLPDASGLDIIKHAKERLPSCQIIVITGFASIETAVEAIKSGAYDYLTKPLAIDKVRVICKNAIEKITLTDEIAHLRKELYHSFGFENIIGKSQLIQDVFKIIRQTAASDSNVLITGESGTGKELVARAIHYNSQRRGSHFVAVNCGAISRELIEAELFGYVKGAFTGAVRDKTGFLELSSGGTLFLDEIGETTPDFQVKLLRVLQEGEFNKVGSPHITKINTRVIAATNRVLEKAMSEGTFREDLFYRLNVISIQIPPLRQRREDIPLLAVHFLSKYAEKRTDKKIDGLSPEAVEVLSSYDFPGNVRELENAIEYCVTFAHGTVVTVDNLPKSIKGTKIKTLPQEAAKPLKNAIYDFEMTLLKAALKESGGNISHAARLLDIHRQSLQQKIKDFNINIDVYK
ncbi:MAG: sigma-54 dependent transcriptional regulator [Candidatus Magnetominusculus sp. LBB02]|nr:sigma-54 dependent transcriptional regulator [Candidatus Magnetominusculus sp. LBB02]